MSFKCALRAEHHHITSIIAPRTEWYLCWDYVKKATFTNKLSCAKCGHGVSRVD